MVNRPSESGSRRPRGERVAAEVLDRPGRRERADEIEELAARGFRSDEIAEKLGLARSTVNKYRRDPNGELERARRESYRGRCRGCGRPTRGSDGPGRGPEWCPGGAPLRRWRWSDAQMLEAIREWTRLTGGPLPGRARQVAQCQQRGEALRLAARRCRGGRCCGHAEATLSDGAWTAGQRRPADDFPPRRRTSWDFSRVADGQVYLLRKGCDLAVGVDSLAIAARRGAREHGYSLTTRSEFDERQEGRPKAGLYVRFERQGARRRAVD